MAGGDVSTVVVEGGTDEVVDVVDVDVVVLGASVVEVVDDVVEDSCRLVDVVVCGGSVVELLVEAGTLELVVVVSTVVVVS